MAFPILGDIIKSVIGTGGKLISEFITDKDKAAEFTHKLEIAVLEDKQLERDAETRMYEAQQKTIQAELHQNDLYTKRTRPKIARQSWYITMLYAVLTLIVDVAPATWRLGDLNFQWEIFMVLASPALTYMGVRGLEKWKGGGTK